jgi:predicted ATPase/DNA-binding CsgD family transcriptional regulator
VNDSQGHILSTIDSLNQREKEILACLVEGLSNQEIANHLHLALRTVKWYNSQIYSKLEVSNRRGAVNQAQRLNNHSGQAASHTRHNLQHQPTQFIGRQLELSDLSTLIKKQDTRLVTILAPGGMGKTRLALAGARQQLGNFKDGVFFVSLAPLSAPSGIVTSIAESIGFSFYGENPPLQQLTGYLRDREMLLVLDNFEHLLNGALLVSEILRETPGVCILVTSRERLNLHGESLYILRGLDFPAQETIEDAQSYDAFKLFIESARRVRTDFTCQPDDLAFIVRICQLTGGMPLGIELAAGWVDVLSVQQIAEEVQQGIDILETDFHDIPERHRSMRGTFERTWIRLSEEEKAVFRRLSVFRNGFTFPAANTIASASPVNLRRLVQKALILPAEDGRYTIHELLRQFGMGKLAESGELLAVQAGHAAYYTGFMAERKGKIKTNLQLEALKLIDLDFENVRTAWIYLVRAQQWEHLSQFLFSLWFYCNVHTRGQEALDLIVHAEKALRMAPPSAASALALARVLAPLGWYYNDVGYCDKGALICDEAIQLLRQHGSPEDLIIGLFDRQSVAFNLAQPDIAVKLAEEGLAIAQSIGDRYWEGYFLLWAGAGRQDGIHLIFRHTRQFTERALAIFEAIGDRWGMMRALNVLGQAYINEKQYTMAKQCILKALSIAESFRHPLSIAGNCAILANIAIEQSDHADAHRRLRQALQQYWRTGYQWIAPYPLQRIAQTYAAQDELDLAVSILGTIEMHLISLAHTDRRAKALQKTLETQMGPEHFVAAWKRGQEQSLNALVADLLAELDSQ